MRVAGRVAVSLGAINLVLLVMIAAVSAQENFWSDELPAGALPLSAVARTVERHGYDRIVAVEVAGGLYEVKALDARGDRVRLKIDPTTGRIEEAS